MLLDEQNRLNGENGTVTDVANPGSIGEVEGRVVLSDGRRLGYRATGAPDGDPLFYFHGFPGSRLEADLLCKDAGVRGWRVFAIDRPGMGFPIFCAVARCTIGRETSRSSPMRSASIILV